MTTPASGVDLASAAALAAAASKTGGDSAAQTAEEIAAAAAAKANEGKTPEQIAEAAAAAAKAKEAPGEIKYTFTKPKDGVLGDDAVGRVEAFAKAHKLSPEAAQQALEHTNAELVADRARQAEANQEAFEQLAVETWPNEIKADKEFGGDKLDATIREAKRATDAFATPEEQKILRESGWGNHPILVRIMARAGRRMQDDKILTGGSGGSGNEKSAAQTLYGETK